jgi:hypothetical protein
LDIGIDGILHDKWNHLHPIRHVMDNEEGGGGEGGSMKKLPSCWFIHIRDDVFVACLLPSFVLWSFGMS